MPRQYSAEFKLDVVRQLQSGERRLAQICREHDLDPGMVRGWIRRVEKLGPQAFPRSVTAAVVNPLSGHSLATAEARIGELERLVGQLTLENEFLKKVLRRLQAPRPGGTN